MTDQERLFWTIVIIIIFGLIVSLRHRLRQKTLYIPYTGKVKRINNKGMTSSRGGKWIISALILSVGLILILNLLLFDKEL